MAHDNTPTTEVVMPFQLQRPQVVLSLVVLALMLPTPASARPLSDPSARAQGPSLTVNALGTDVAAQDQQASSNAAKAALPSTPVSGVEDDGGSVISFWLVALIAFGGLAMAYRLGTNRNWMRPAA